MTEYYKNIDIRWSDLDPNFHVKHSSYYDFGAYCRMCFFTDHGLTMQIMRDNTFGPVLLREECVFKRELHFGDEVAINVRLKHLWHDHTRWTLVHELYKNKEKLAAVITIDGAWIDSVKRKLTAPPPIANRTFEALIKTPDYSLIEKKL